MGTLGVGLISFFSEIGEKENKNAEMGHLIEIEQIGGGFLDEKKFRGLGNDVLDLK